MNFINTRDTNNIVSFKEATLKGLAANGGLYFPDRIPKYSDIEIKALLELPNIELATKVLFPFVEDDMSQSELHDLLREVLNFETPLVHINENIFSLELFHGPTLAFKDVGARFMSRCLAKFSDKNKPVRVLVATSGDTGSAVANGFWNVSGVEVVILFPKNGVSTFQESQMTTLGGNITAIEIEGDFDDCQRLVKSAFLDQELNRELNLSSANSINVARFLPQMLYYLFAIKELINLNKSIVFSVPSGNFGNLTAGLIAQKMGFPISRFMAATNANDVFYKYLKTGEYQSAKTIKTLSNAMDVGAPSNLERIQFMFNNELTEIKKHIDSCTITDEETLDTIRAVYDKHQYLLDPHGAVAYSAIENKLDQNEIGVILGTAHPCKFESAVRKALPNYQSNVKVDLSNANKMSMSNEYEAFKSYLLNLI